MEFKLIVVKADVDNLWVYTSLPEEVQTKLGDACKTHTFTMKSPINYGLEMDKQNLMLVPDAMGLGLRVEGSLDYPARIVAYLKSWTLDEPLTLDGAKSLHPALLEPIATEISFRVRRGGLGLEDFFPELLTNGEQSPDTPSPPSE
jgi:hypothetical protein